VVDAFSALGGSTFAIERGGGERERAREREYVRRRPRLSISLSLANAFRTTTNEAKRETTNARECARRERSRDERKAKDEAKVARYRARASGTTAYGSKGLTSVTRFLAQVHRARDSEWSWNRDSRPRRRERVRVVGGERGRGRDRVRARRVPRRLEAVLRVDR